MMLDDNHLEPLLAPGKHLRTIEPHIYSVIDSTDSENSFDDMGRFYDLVVCNRVYNRLLWGYSISDYGPFTEHALNSSAKGWILDAGCGSLAFNAKIYAAFSKRPVVLLDHSIKLLKIAKSRLLRLHNKLPENIVFLHGDALSLPFNPCSFQTILSLNLLHVFTDVSQLLREFKTVLAEDGYMSFTTLVASNRLADKYLAALLNKTCGVAPRTINDLQAAFAKLGMAMRCRVDGNMAFIT